MDLENLQDAATLTGLEYVPVLQNGVWVKAQVYQVNAAPTPTVTANVTGLTATPISDVQIDISFSGAGDNYIIERSIDQFTWSEVYTGPLTSFSDTNLVGDFTFYYRVKAQFTAQADSGFVFVNATTLAPP